MAQLSLKYRRGSYCRLILTGVRASSGTLCTNANTAIQMTLTDKFSGVVINGVSNATVTYVSAGLWQIDITSGSNTPGNQIMVADFRIYDNTVTTPRGGQTVELQPLFPDSGLFRRNAINRIQIVNAKHQDGTTATSASYTAACTIKDEIGGTSPVLSAPATYGASLTDPVTGTVGPGWYYDAPASAFPSQGKVLATMAVTETGPFLVVTQDLRLFDGG